MGFFDRFKKPSPSAPQIPEMNQTLFNEITQEVAMYMYEVGITKQPALSFFHDDGNIFLGMFYNAISNPGTLQLRDMSDDIYLQVVGMHAFGAGAHVTVCQLRYNHPVSQFTDDEAREIAMEFSQTDAYEIALNELKIPVDSPNKRVIDQITLTAMRTAAEKVGSDKMRPENIRAYMQTLYNAGISMYTLRKIG